MSQSSEVSSLFGQASPLERRIIIIFKGFHYFGAACIAFITGLNVVHAVGRYGFDRPVPGAVELCCLGLVVSVFLTGGYTMAAKGHIEIPLLVDRFPKRTQAIIVSVMYLLSLVFSGLVVWQSFVYGNAVMELGTTTPVLRIPHSPFIYILGIGWVLFALAILMDLIHSVLRATKR